MPRLRTDVTGVKNMLGDLSRPLRYLVNLTYDIAYYQYKFDDSMASVVPEV